MSGPCSVASTPLHRIRGGRRRPPETWCSTISKISGYFIRSACTDPGLASYACTPGVLTRPGSRHVYPYAAWPRSADHLYYRHFSHCAVRPWLTTEKWALRRHSSFFSGHSRHLATLAPHRTVHTKKKLELFSRQYDLSTSPSSFIHGARVLARPLISLAIRLQDSTVARLRFTFGSLCGRGCSTLIQTWRLLLAIFHWLKVSTCNAMW